MEKVYIVVEDSFFKSRENHIILGCYRNFEKAKEKMLEEKEKFLEDEEVDLDETENGEKVYDIVDKNDHFGIEDRYTGSSYDITILAEDVQ